jgi:AbrB family looped-hinge helix DNA binding protein
MAPSKIFRNVLATLITRGRVTIPVEVRQALGLEASDLISFVKENGEYVLKIKSASKS